jgi:hypothetical protein
MSLCTYTVKKVTASAPSDAWSEIVAYTWNLFAYELPCDETAEAAVVERDKQLSQLEALLSGSAWDLWEDFAGVVPKASQSLIDFWHATPDGKAILVLDGLSLREFPWLLAQALQRGFQVLKQECRASELPAETTPFAKALGLGQRSVLSNNGASETHPFKNAVTETSDLPWRDCIDLISARPNVLFWHHWPDNRMHDNSVPGAGLPKHLREVHSGLTSDDFWSFVTRLATGRKLVITSDHGYAACGQFPDITDANQAAYAKSLFRGKRYSTDIAVGGPWIPPMDLRLTSSNGSNRYVLGRRKWKMPSGYPTLQHGGLSLLEVLVPFLELST